MSDTATKIERRVMPVGGIEVRKDEDGTPHIVGYGAVYYDANDPGTEFELWDGAFERIMPGAFDRAMKEDDVRGLFNYDSNQLLGRTPKTMTLAGDAKGMRYDITAPDTQVGRDVVTLVERGDVNGSSFSFNVTDEAWRKEDGKEIRELMGVELFDEGPVTYPAYKGTDVGIRAVGELTEARASYEKWIAENASADDSGDTDTSDSDDDTSNTEQFPLKEARRRRLEKSEEARKDRVRESLERDIERDVLANREADEGIRATTEQREAEAERVAKEKRDNEEAVRLHAARLVEAKNQLRGVREKYEAECPELDSVFEVIERI